MLRYFVIDTWYFDHSVCKSDQVSKYQSIQYKVSNTTHQEMIANNIKSFVVKVCLFGEEDVPPVIKDLRVVALDWYKYETY